MPWPDPTAQSSAVGSGSRTATGRLAARDLDRNGDAHRRPRRRHGAREGLEQTSPKPGTRLQARQLGRPDAWTSISEQTASGQCPRRAATGRALRSTHCANGGWQPPCIESVAARVRTAVDAQPRGRNVGEPVAIRWPHGTGERRRRKSRDGMASGRSGAGRDVHRRFLGNASESRGSRRRSQTSTPGSTRSRARSTAPHSRRWPMRAPV